MILLLVSGGTWICLTAEHNPLPTIKSYVSLRTMDLQEKHGV
jgi:hypothetical protein